MKYNSNNMAMFMLTQTSVHINHMLTYIIDLRKELRDGASNNINKRKASEQVTDKAIDRFIARFSRLYL